MDKLKCFFLNGFHLFTFDASAGYGTIWHWVFIQFEILLNFGISKYNP